MNTFFSKIGFDLILFFFTLSSIAGYASFAQVEQLFIQNPENGNKIELFISKPQGEGPFPIVFLLHGYQPLENTLGGKQLIDYGYLDRFVKEGIAGVALSIPGYGKSDGCRDFGGPDSQKALIAVINYFKMLPFIDSSRMGIYGISRGAQLAGMVSSNCPDLTIQILESGFYDLVSFCSEAPDYLQGIKESLLLEGGATAQDLVERSPIYHTHKVKASTLILQGEWDDRKQLPAAQLLQTKLLTQGVSCILKIYPDELHVLPLEKRETIIPFVRQHFFNLYGIGIKVVDPIPAIQISKIYDNSPAFKSGKLKVGDVILCISPENDKCEIETLRMPVNQFVSLMLGKKGTKVRLHIQHFDLSHEDVIIQRG